MKPTAASVLARLDQIQTEHERERGEDADWRILEAYCLPLEGLAFLALAVAVGGFTTAYQAEAGVTQATTLGVSCTWLGLGLLLLRQVVSLRRYFASRLDELSGFFKFFGKSAFSLRAWTGWATSNRERAEILRAAKGLRTVMIVIVGTTSVLVLGLVFLLAALVFIAAS